MKKVFVVSIIVLTALYGASMVVLWHNSVIEKEISPPTAVQTLAVTEPEPEPVINYEEEKNKLTEKINSIISNKSGQCPFMSKTLKRVWKWK